MGARAHNRRREGRQIRKYRRIVARRTQTLRRVTEGFVALAAQATEALAALAAEASGASEKLAEAGAALAASRKQVRTAREQGQGGLSGPVSTDRPSEGVSPSQSATGPLAGTSRTHQEREQQ